MTTLREAAQMALDALEAEAIPTTYWEQTITALRAALAQPERQWQGLTDEDLSVCDEDGVILARYWEAKLREKNT